MASKEFNQIEYIAGYNKAHYDRIELKVPKGRKAVWTEVAKAKGLKLSTYIIACVEEDIKAEADTE